VAGIVGRGVVLGRARGAKDIHVLRESLATADRFEKLMVPASSARRPASRRINTRVDSSVVGQGDTSRQPPLANGLFDPRPLFTDVLRELPRAVPLIGRLRRAVSDGAGIEPTLERIQSERATYPSRRAGVREGVCYAEVATGTPK
jgi:hypothetical protein